MIQEITKSEKIKFRDERDIPESKPAPSVCCSLLPLKSHACAHKSGPKCQCKRWGWALEHVVSTG